MPFRNIIISSLSDIENIVVASSPTGTPILVRNIANVHFAPMVRRGFASQDGKGEIVIGVAMAAGTEVFAPQTAAPHALLGASLIFISAISYAGYLVISGRLIPRIGATAFTAYTMLVISLTSAVHFVLTPHPVSLTGLPVQVYGISLLMAIVATVLPSFLLSAGIHRIGSNRAALLGTIGPVSTIVLAWMFLGEGVTSLQLLGTLFVVTGVLAISTKN